MKHKKIYVTILILIFLYENMIGNIFLRHFIYTSLGMVFFAVMFFGNLDMIFTQNNVLTQMWIPGFIWWLWPLSYFLLLGLFIIFQLRCIYGKKAAKKNLRKLHLSVSIFYGFFSIILLLLIFFGLNDLFVIFTIFLALGLRNYYIYYRIKTKTYLWNFEPKDFFFAYTLYMLVFWMVILLFSRWILPDFNNHANTIYKTYSQNIQKEIIDVIPAPNVDDYLESLANKDDIYTDYEVLIYNLNDEYVHQLYNIYQSSENITLGYQSVQYDYNNLMLVQRYNILKYQYHILHWDTMQAQETMITILKLNNLILNNSHTYIDVKAFMLMQNFALDYYQKYGRYFSQEQKNSINQNIHTIDIQTLWEHLLINEFSFKIKQYNSLYNIPLFINKHEMKNIEYYYFMQKLQNPLDNIQKIQANFHRSNYIGLWITQMSHYPTSSGYKSLVVLSNRIDGILQ